MNVRIRAAVLALTVAFAASVSAAHAAALLPTQIIAGTRIAVVADRIAKTLVHDADRAVAPAFQIVDQSVPVGNVTIAESGTPQINASYISIPIAIRVDGAVARTLYAGFRVTTYMQTVVAAHDLAQGAIVGADDLTLTRVPFMGRPGVTAATIVGRKVRSAVTRGSPIFPEGTIVNELVRAGMPAVLIVHDGSVALSADVVARTGGGIGDYVTVYNPQTQRALSGIVTGPNIVELTLPGAN